jgi:diguanylate cyclase (GGDEF)-like protein/PAS domain S-box-containing protein
MVCWPFTPTQIFTRIAMLSIKRTIGDRPENEEALRPSETEQSARPTRLRLKTRLSIGVVLIVLVTTFAITISALFFVKRSMKETIATEQFDRLSAIGSAIDQKFLSRRTLLKTFGDSVEAQHFSDSAPLQGFLEQHHSLKEAFDNVAFLDHTGKLVANLNGTKPIGRVNVSDRPYFIDTVASKRGVISQPIRNRVNGIAQVVMTEPILDDKGDVRYVMSGAINLQENNFLGEVANVKFGATGYMFIANTDGIIIDHPQKSRILKRYDADGGRNLAAENALAGFEGTTEASSVSGVAGLYAFKHIRQTNWILGGVYPSDEAFATVRIIERNALAGAMLLALLAGSLALIAIRSQLDPLSLLHDHMLATQDAQVYIGTGLNYPNDEIGDLGRAFATLMTQRQEAVNRVAASERFVRGITDNLPAAIGYFDRNERARFLNKAAANVNTLNAPVPVGASAREALTEALYLQHVPHIAKVLDGKFTRFEGVFERNGDVAYFQCSLVPDPAPDGSVAGFYVMTFDITRQKRAEQARIAVEQRLRAITDNLPVLITYVDEQQIYRFCNRTMLEWTGLDPAAVLGRTIKQTIGEAEYALRAWAYRRVEAGETVDVELPAVGSGRDRIVHTQYLPAFRDDGTVGGFYGLSTDVTLARKMEADLKVLARIDALTALPNRRQFEENLGISLARALRSGKGMAVLFLDIDHFKAINDSLGHASGDAVLTEFAHRLKQCVRSTDTVARLAGDEFVIVLDNLATEKEAELVARKVLRAMEPVFLLERGNRQVSVSIGIAYHGTGIIEDDALLDRADSALYQAKAAGRANYRLYAAALI